MAEILGLVSRKSVGNLETGITEHIQGATLENLLDLCAYRTEQDLADAIEAGEFPDLPALKDRSARMSHVRGDVGASNGSYVPDDLSPRAKALLAEALASSDVDKRKLQAEVQALFDAALKKEDDDRVSRERRRKANGI